MQIMALEIRQEVLGDTFFHGYTEGGHFCSQPEKMAESPKDVEQAFKLGLKLRGESNNVLTFWQS